MGEIIALRDARSAKPVPVRVTGLYLPRDPASPYWGLNLIGASGVASVGGFTTYGPLIVSPAAFGHALTGTAASWVAIPVTARIPEGDLDAVAARVRAQQQALQNPAGPLGGLRVTTSLPAVLRGVASDLVVSRSLIGIGALELFILGGAALAAAARLLAGRREAELALLAARGGARWQLARIGAAEALLLAGLAAIAGTAAGGPLAWLLARGGPLRAAGPRISDTPPSVWLALVAGAVAATAIALIPVLRPELPGLARVRRGRRALISRFARVGADVTLIAIAALAVWQIREYSAVARSAQGHAGRRPRPRSGARARAGGGHGRPAPAAAARRARGRAGSPAPPQGARGAGHLAVQPPPAPPGGPRAPGRARRGHRNAGAVPAPDLGRVRAGSSRLPGGRAGPGGHPAPGLARAGTSDHGRAGGARRNAGGTHPRRPGRTGPRGGREPGGTHNSAACRSRRRAGPRAVRPDHPTHPAWLPASRPRRTVHHDGEPGPGIAPPRSGTGHRLGAGCRRRYLFAAGRAAPGGRAPAPASGQPRAGRHRPGAAAGRHGELHPAVPAIQSGRGIHARGNRRRPQSHHTRNHHTRNQPHPEPPHPEPPHPEPPHPEPPHPEPPHPARRPSPAPNSAAGRPPRHRPSW